MQNDGAVKIVPIEEANQVKHGKLKKKVKRARKRFRISVDKQNSVKNRTKLNFKIVTKRSKCYDKTCMVFRTFRTTHILAEVLAPTSIQRLLAAIATVGSVSLSPGVCSKAVSESENKNPLHENIFHFGTNLRPD